MAITLENCKDQLAMPGAIELSYIMGSGRFWSVMNAITIMLSNGKEITIPIGFKTDLSSVPRRLWGFDSPFGDFLLAALIHDYLYSNNIGERKEADREMLIWSNRLNDNYLDNYVRFLAVRIFGASWWNS